MKKRILMYRWKAYNYIDIKENFLKMGFEVDEIKQKLENYDVDEAFAEKFKKQLRSKAYDFVFTVNYFALISDACEQLQIPYVSWTCDNPLISMYHKSVFNQCNRIFTFDMTNYKEFKDMGVKNIYYLPLAVDAVRMDHLFAASSADDMQMYANDISFVGSLYERNSYDKMKYTLSDYLQGYFEALMEAQRDLQGVNVVERMLTPDILEQLEEQFELEKSPGSFSDLALIFSTTTLGFKIAQKQRKSALLELSKKHSVSIYSNSDTSDLIRVKYRGSVDYWSQMPKVFHGSKINLNMTIPNIKSGIPLRVWDILGAGGFLLTNFQAEIPMYFEDGKDLVCYYNQDDLLDKASYYLAHDDERCQIARNGNNKIREEHSYEKRLQQIMDVLRETT